MSKNTYPPRGYVVREEWLSLYDRSDPGDIAKPVGVKFIPHKDLLHTLIHVVSMEEHTALLAQARAKVAQQVLDFLHTVGAEGVGRLERSMEAVIRAAQAKGTTDAE